MVSYCFYLQLSTLTNSKGQVFDISDNVLLSHHPHMDISFIIFYQRHVCGVKQQVLDVSVVHLDFLQVIKCFFKPVALCA